MLLLKNNQSPTPSPATRPAGLSLASRSQPARSEQLGKALPSHQQPTQPQRAATTTARDRRDSQQPPPAPSIY